MDLFLLAFILLTGFYMAWNIGANDVANAMGTSVGSGALTLKQAVLLAAILEFSGAFFFGSNVSKTMQSGIVNANLFAGDPKILVYGMLSALASAGLWLQIASYCGWPVSTTHSIVGAIVGFGAIVGGLEAIYWKNVAWIIFSWILSPLLGGVFGYFIFTLLKKKIFYVLDPLKATYRLTPFLVFIVLLVLGLVFVFEALKNIHFNVNAMGKVMIALAFSLLGAGLSYFVLKKHANLNKNEMTKTNSHLAYIEVEKIFTYLQIMSAGMMAFAHGANDVANAIGPLSAALAILLTGLYAIEAPIPWWALGIGAVGIVVGLATWGWRVIETVGKKITELTPSRGFSAEFAAATTIVFASCLGLPISTTHTLVGAILGVGLARGLEAINLNTTRDILISWVITVPLGAALSIVLFYPIKAIFS